MVVSKARRLFFKARRLFFKARRLFFKARRLFFKARRLFFKARRLFFKARRLFSKDGVAPVPGIKRSNLFFQPQNPLVAASSEFEIGGK